MLSLAVQSCLLVESDDWLIDPHMNSYSLKTRHIMFCVIQHENMTMNATQKPSLLNLSWIFCKVEVSSSKNKQV